MNQKSIIAILVVVVVILIGTTVYFATINKAVAPAPKVVQQSASAPVVQPTPESSKSAFDKTALQNTVFSAVDAALKVKYNATKDPGYATWDKKVEITSVDSSLKAAKGEWWASDAWPWISWQQKDGSWKVLLSFDGFDCTALKSVPSQYDKFFQDVVYFRDTKTQEYNKKNCY